MVDCNNCRKNGLSWDNTYFENTGKWRLWDTAMEQPHECPQPKKTWKKVICPKCDPCSDKKFIPENKLQAHIKKEHIDWGDYT